jgi:hypothetical protein
MIKYLIKVNNDLNLRWRGVVVKLQMLSVFLE